MARETNEPGKPRSRENDNLKPGAPPRSKTDPPGSELSVKNRKTMTDPSTGEPSQDRPNTAP